VKTYTCKNGCGTTKTEPVKANGSHTPGSWTVTKEATAVAEGTREQKCTVCGTVVKTETIAKLKGTIKLNATSITLQAGKSTNKIVVSGLAAGDSIKSWKSSNTKIVTVDKKGTIKAVGKAKQKDTVTEKLASGTTGKIEVTIQKDAVKTKKIKLASKKITLKKGSKQTLTPVITPITSQDKVTYESSNKKVATVSKKGVVTAKAAGTAKITVKSGSKKAVVTVVVAKTATTKITVAKTSLTLKKGKTSVLKPKLTPASSDDTITYKSSNTKVASVDKNGKITAKKAGKAVITVKAGKASVRVTVTVKG
jgi:hypothetical protein